jgi:importin-5
MTIDLPLLRIKELALTNTSLFILQFGGEGFAVTCAQAIPHLVDIILAPGSRDPENVSPTENAISAVTKILKYNSTSIQNTDEIITLW